MPQPDSVQAFIGLGSNLDRPLSQIRRALRRLSDLPGTRVIRCSSAWGSAPIGLAQQPDFVNAVCLLETSLDPERLLPALLAIERAHGRIRDVPGGPRTLDLDLLLHGPRQVQQPGLTLPHPRLHERAFVLYPLHEIAPDLDIPGRGPLAALLAACAGQRIERLGNQRLEPCASEEQT